MAFSENLNFKYLFKMSYLQVAVAFFLDSIGNFKKTWHQISFGRFSKNTLSIVIFAIWGLNSWLLGTILDWRLRLLKPWSWSYDFGMTWNVCHNHSLKGAECFLILKEHQNTDSSQNLQFFAIFFGGKHALWRKHVVDLSNFVLKWLELFVITLI